jgi:hypothetical protein
VEYSQRQLLHDILLTTFAIVYLLSISVILYNARCPTFQGVHSPPLEEMAYRPSPWEGLGRRTVIVVLLFIEEEGNTYIIQSQHLKEGAFELLGFLATKEGARP